MHVKPKPRDSLQNNSVLCKSIKIMKDKESLRNCPRSKETGQDYEKQCGILDEILDQKKDLRERQTLYDSSYM